MSLNWRSLCLQVTNILTSPPLVGFSHNGDEKLLVYKYEINGSLDKHLASTTLTWDQRLRICLGAARGLEYIHGGVGTGHRMLHRNIKSSNILLDENWEPKISDFEMFYIGHLMKNECIFVVSKGYGSVGYVDPQYLKTGIFSKESDVYSFGVVLFELLCGRLAVMEEYHDERKFLAKFVKRCYKEGNYDDMIMPNLLQKIKPYMIQMFSDIAYQCLNKDFKQRPSMKSIVQQLQNCFDYQTGSYHFL